MVASGRRMGVLMYYVYYILYASFKIKSFKSKKEADLFIKTLGKKSADTWFDFMFKEKIVSAASYYDTDLLE